MLTVGDLIEILKTLPAWATARAYDGEGNFIVIEVTDKWHQAQEVALIDTSDGTVERRQ